MDNTNVLSGSEDVEKSSLSSARGTHKSSELTRTNVTKDIVQKTTGTTGNGNIVVKVLPSKDTLRLDVDLRTLLVGPVLASSIALRGKLLVQSLALLVRLGEDGSSVTAHTKVDEFTKSDVEEEEEDDKSEDDTPVSPEVAGVVGEALGDVVGSGDESGSGLGTGESADLVVDVGVLGSRRNQAVSCALHVDFLELVHHHGTEAETQDVDPEDPSEPHLFLGVLDDIS